MHFDEIKNIENLIISDKASVANALEVIEKSGLRLVIIVDQSLKILGVLSDGDIRRAVLKNVLLGSSVTTIMNTSYFSVNSSDTSNLNAVPNYVEILPVLDNNGRVKSILRRKFSIPSLTPIADPFLIMAGGKGTRLYPLTKDIPKPLVSINNEPMIKILIEKAKAAGFGKFIVSVNYLKEQIIDYLGDGEKFGVEISYLEEKQPLGTAGSLGLISNHNFENIFITNCDIITGSDYRKIYDRHVGQKWHATMAVKRFLITNPYGVVETIENGLISDFTEKPVYESLINAGIYVLGSEIISLLKRNEYLDMPSLFLRAIGAGLTCSTHQIFESWTDIGMRAELEEVRNEARLR